MSNGRQPHFDRSPHSGLYPLFGTSWREHLGETNLARKFSSMNLYLCAKEHDEIPISRVALLEYEIALGIVIAVTQLLR